MSAIPRYALSFTAILAFFTASSGLTGRVVDEARRLPVEGAVVTQVGGQELDTTDTEGRFELFAQAGNGPLSQAFPVPFIKGNELFLAFERETLTEIEGFDVMGNKLFSTPLRKYVKGNHRVDLSVLFPDKSRTSVGFMRLRTGDKTRIYKIIQFSTADEPELKVSPGWALGKPSAATQAGQIELTKELLQDKTVNYTETTDDLGDIVMEYPPRDPGLGAVPIYGAQVLFDGTETTLEENWEMWQSPWRIENSLEATPITWIWLDDPNGDERVIGSGELHNTDYYGRQDLVTRNDYRDFQVHVEFAVLSGSNSGVYLQNRYEIQIMDGGGVGHLYSEANRTSNEYSGTGEWNAYDITFRAARWDGDNRTQLALLSMYWNGVKVHENVEADQSYGQDYGGDIGLVLGGEPVGPSDEGLKLQNHGSDNGEMVLYRNIWLLELDIEEQDTDFGY
ncbi:DUF1080 domain-containing protein [Fibrobacterota bacterium]